MDCYHPRMHKLQTPATYTDAELLAHARAAIVRLAAAEETEFNGQRIKRSALPGMWQLVNDLEARIEKAAAGTRPGVVQMVQIGRGRRAC